MADVTMWQDKKVQAEFEARQRHASANPGRAGRAGRRGGHRAQERRLFRRRPPWARPTRQRTPSYPDEWVYFVRLDDPGAAIALPTW
jgi:hypothetical protein